MGYLLKRFQKWDVSPFFKGSTIMHIVVLGAIIISPLLLPKAHKYRRPTVHNVAIVNIPEVKQKISTPAPKPKQEVKKQVKKTTPPKPIKKSKPKKTKTVKKLKPKPIPAALNTPSLEERLAKNIQTSKTKPIQKTITQNKTKTTSTPKFSARVSSQQKFPFQYYLDIIHSKIGSCWHEPKMVLDKEYSSIISFTITDTGEIKGVNIKRSSGVNTFDQSGVKAIELAKPFPPLPPGYKHSQLTINVAFNLE